MSQYEHCVRRTLGRAFEYVELCDGRGTTTMPIEEFMAFASHIAAVASGSQESTSAEYLEREMDFHDQRDPELIAERAKEILSTLGIGQKKQRFSLLKGR